MINFKFGLFLLLILYCSQSLYSQNGENNKSSKFKNYREKENLVHVGVGLNEKKEKKEKKKILSSKERYNAYISNSSDVFVGLNPEANKDNKFAERIKLLKSSDSLNRNKKVIKNHLADTVFSIRKGEIDFDGSIYPGILEKRKKSRN